MFYSIFYQNSPDLSVILHLFSRLDSDYKALGTAEMFGARYEAHQQYTYLHTHRCNSVLYGCTFSWIFI